MKISEVSSPVPGCQAFRSNNNLSVICGREPLGPNGELRWHLSVAHNHRNPTWEEIRDLRYMLIPDEVMMAMFLPPMEEYVDLHRYCFHLYEVESSDVPGCAHMSEEDHEKLREAIRLFDQALNDDEVDDYGFVEIMREVNAILESIKL